VHDELIYLHEGAGIEEQIESLARGPFPGLVLAANPLLASPQLGFSAPVAELFEAVVKGHAIGVFLAADYREPSLKKSTYSLTFARLPR